METRVVHGDCGVGGDAHQYVFSFSIEDAGLAVPDENSAKNLAASTDDRRGQIAAEA